MGVRHPRQQVKAEPIKELTDTAAYGEEGVSDDYDGEQDETEDDEIHATDPAGLLGNSGEDPEADDALAEALQLDAVAMVAWERFNGKGKGKVKGKGKGKYKGNNLSLEERKKHLAVLRSQLSSVQCAWTLGRRRHLSQECQEREYIATTCTRISDYRRRDIRFRHRLDW